jgi:hypothetical protein
MFPEKLNRIRAEFGCWRSVPNGSFPCGFFKDIDSFLDDLFLLIPLQCIRPFVKITVMPNLMTEIL